GLAERREPASRPVSPVHFGRSGSRVPRQRQPAVPGPHLVVRHPPSPSLRVPLLSPPASSMHVVANPASDQFRAEHSTVTRLLATVVTDPSFESATAPALVAELVDFAAACRLDYAASLVAESESVCPPSVGGECALSTDVLEDTQEDLECLAAAAPHLVAMLLAPEGDPDAPDIPTPRSYAEAIAGPYSSQWQTAMDAEMASWKSIGNYFDELPPPGENIVSGMWIFRVKRPPDSPPFFKARYVAQGFGQRQGVEFFQTFSPTPKMTTLRVLLHVAAQRDYELHSLDFSTAFLQGSLHEEIWLRRPPGFTGSFPPGTQTTLAALGFAPWTADPSLFLRTDTSLPPYYILVYVDDLVFATAYTEALALVKSELQKRYTCTDLEPSGPYPELVGCLMYLMTCTRPDLAYPLGLLARYVAPGRHRKVHMDAAKRVLRYLCSTSGMGLVLGGRGDVVLTGHSDASWRSTRSSSVLGSSCEAEIYATAMAAQELCWLTYLLTNLGEQPCSSPMLYVDNKAAIAFYQEHRQEHRTKHIAVRYFLARELQQRGQLRLAHVATRANTADILTKALPPCDHQPCFAFPDWSCDPLFSPTLPMGPRTPPLAARSPPLGQLAALEACSPPFAALAPPLAACSPPLAARSQPFACPPCSLHRPAPARSAAGHPSRAPPCPTACFSAGSAPPCSARYGFSPCPHVRYMAPRSTAHKTAKALYDAVVACYSSPATAALGRLILPYLFPELSAFATVEDLVTHLRTSDAHYRAALPAEFLTKNPPAMYINLYFLVTRLPDSLRAVRDHFLALDPTDLTVNLLEQHLLAGETSIIAVGAARGTPRTPFFEGCSPSPLAPSYTSAAAVDVLGAEDVRAASASGKCRSSKGKGGRSSGGGSGGGSGGASGGGGGGGGGGTGGSGGGSGGFGDGSGGSGGSGGIGGSGSGGSRGGAVQRGGSGSGQRQQQQRRSKTTSPHQLCEWFAQHGASGGSVLCSYVIRTADRAGQTCKKPHTQYRCFSSLDDAWRAEFGDEDERPRWAELLRSGVAIFDLDYDAILVAMYALSFSAEGVCYLCVLPDPGIEAAALGTSESALPGTASAEALHPFTLDSGASRCFFCDSTILTPLSTPVPVTLADPSGGPILARSTTVLPCPAVLSGSLSGLHLPLFSTNLVITAVLQDAMVTTTTPRGQRVSICTCTRTGRHLATFTRRPGSSLYTLAAKPPQVAAFAQVSASGLVAPPCLGRLLSHQTLLWHHRLGHPSLPRLRGMHSHLLVSGLPRSLPPLPPSPAPPCLPCVEGRQRAAPQSSSFPLTTAPLQTLHIDVWGSARVSGQGSERYFLLVVDDYMHYTAVFPLRIKGEVPDVLIPWIRSVRLQLRERFRQDLPVLRMHSDRGGEFSSDLLQDFCCGEGILHTFTLSASPQKNGIAERRIGLVMEVARTSMIHVVAPHFLWPFAVRYTAHQLNLWPRVSLPETSPTLHWTEEVGNASVLRVWGSRAFVRDTSADKLSAHAIPCIFLGFPSDAPGWQFYHPTSCRVLPSQDVTFDESVPFYHLFPYRSAPLPPPPLFLAFNPLPGTVPVEVGEDSGATRGAASGGAASEGAVSRGAEPVGAEPEGAKSEGARFGGAELGGVEPGGAELGGVELESAEPGGVESEGVESGGAELRGTASSGGAASAPQGLSPLPEPLSPQQLRELFARCTRLRILDGAGGLEGAGAAGPEGTGAAGAGGAASARARGTGVGAPRGTGAAGPGGAQPGGTRATGAGGVANVGAGDPGAGAAGVTGAAGPGGAHTGGTGAAGASGAAGVGAGDTGAGGDGPGGTGVVGASSGETGRPRSYFVPLLQQVLGLLSSSGLTPPLLCPPPDQSHLLLQPPSPLPTPSPYTKQTRGLTEHREPLSRPALPVRSVRTGRRVPCLRPPPVPGTHHMTLRPSSVPQRVPLPSPPTSSLADGPDPESDLVRAASPTVSRLLAIVVTDPSFESAAAPTLVAELVDFAVACRLDYAASLVAESESDCPPSVGGECALGTDDLEDRHEDFGISEVHRHLRRRSSPSWGEHIPWHVDFQGEAAAVFFACSQRQGVDFFHTFSPTPKMTTLRVLLHVTAQRDYELRSLDFCTAFLQGSLHEEIWLRRPPGFTGSFPAGTQWSLRRLIYGLRHAPREWHDTLRMTLAALGFAPSTAHPSMFLRTDTSLPPFYVLVYVLQRFGFRYSLPQSTPLPTGHSLSSPPSDESEAAKRVLRYLCSTSGMGIVLGGWGAVVLTGHADASWVDNLATQRSSSCEAEIYAGAMAAHELRWLTYLLTDLGEPPRSSPVLYVDNKAMIALCQEHRLEHRTKHIALRYFLARDLQQRGQLCLAYVATRANTTDIFTKALQSGDHQRFCTVLGLVPTLPPLLTA
ncbi:unnamed protein product, partial [Closterium sp. NIES-53]